MNLFIYLHYKKLNLKSNTYKNINTDVITNYFKSNTMSTTSFHLQQQAELREYLSTNTCIVCDTDRHSCSSCDSNAILEFEIKLLQKILLLVTHPHGGDLIWLYLKNNNYYMLATFAHTRLNMPVDINNLEEDDYICHIWMNYRNVFRYGLADERIIQLETRLHHCMELHPNYLFQSAVNSLLQLSRNFNNNVLEQEETQEEEEEDHVPINVIEPGDDDDVEISDYLLQLNSSQNDDINEFDIDLFMGYIEELPLSVDCPICLENIPLDKVVRLQCDEKHLYCSDCIVDVCHANPKCSLCRVSIENITVYSDETFDTIAPCLM